LGGTISTVVMKRPAASFAARRERSASGTGSIGWADAGAAATAVECRGETLCTKPAIALMCSGVVPQQPPTNRAPASTMRLAYVPMYSGLAM
jgi:hypothetical protein